MPISSALAQLLGFGGAESDPASSLLMQVADYQNRGRPDLGGAEMDRAAGMGVTARGGGSGSYANSTWDAMKQYPENAANIARSRIRQIEYDRRLSGYNKGGPNHEQSYPANGELEALRRYLRTLEPGA